MRGINMATFDDFWGALTGAVAKLATGALADYKAQVVADGQAFAEKLKSDLAAWTQQLANGQIDQDELQFLINGKRVLAELMALKQKGLARVALDQFFNDLVNTIVTTAIKFFPKA